MYEYEYSDPGAFGALGTGYIIFMLLIAAFYIFCYWKVFEKAGQPGWAAIIPIYNIYIMLQIVGKPGWWLILMLIPCVNIIIALLIYLDMARVFGKSTGFGIGLFLLGFIFLPILAFGDAEYQG
jgi:hypothetical protein